VGLIEEDDHGFVVLLYTHNVVGKLRYLRRSLKIKNLILETLKPMTTPHLEQVLSFS